MRRYDDPVEVRRGTVPGQGAGGEAPAQFLWHGRLWKVRAVVARWVETGPWWTSVQVRAVTGAEDGSTTDLLAPGDWGAVQERLLAEREVWRVEAGRPGHADAGPDGGMSSGVFDLAHDVADGRWLLVGCLD